LHAGRTSREKQYEAEETARRASGSHTEVAALCPYSVPKATPSAPVETNIPLRAIFPPESFRLSMPPPAWKHAFPSAQIIREGQAKGIAAIPSATSAQPAIPDGNLGNVSQKYPINGWRPNAMTLYTRKAKATSIKSAELFL